MILARVINIDFGRFFSNKDERENIDLDRTLTDSRRVFCGADDAASICFEWTIHSMVLGRNGKGLF